MGTVMEEKLPFQILYEDNHLLVVEKPVNVPVQADVTGDDDLLSMCRRYIKVKYNKPGEVYLALVHRLDRPVGGVMVFAKTSKAAARLTSQFKGHTAKKRYAAVVEGEAKHEAHLIDFLKKDEQSHSSAVVPEGTDGAKRAELRYSLLGQKNGLSLLDVQLYTGRAHQIRVQLSNSGCPIVGDQRYNKNASVGMQIRLWAYALTIEHPTLGEQMTFFSVPRGAVFSDFAAEMAMLPAFSVCRGVYMDDDLLVVDKHAGVEVEDELLIALESIVGEVYPVHRLDANTEGLVAFARTESMRDTLLDAFRTHENIEKVYHAVLCGVPDRREGTLEHTLSKDAEGSFVRVVPRGTAGGLSAKLSYRVLATKGELSLVEIRLFTGRTHQIRVQMAAIGCPVLGDDKYGNREANRKYKKRKQQLLAKRLTVLGRVFKSCRELSL